MDRVKIGVIGTGVLGGHHTRILATLPGAELVGIYDANPARLAEISAKFNVKPFGNPDGLFEICEAIVIATPTGTHREVAEKALDAGCHLLVEKPIADNAGEGAFIVAKAEKLRKTLMIGHIEQFNPAFEAARGILDKPLFVESHRLTAFRGRGADVTVVHDLLIHDLELLLAVLNEEIVSIDSSAKAILTETPDIANVRLKFFGGCVANLTASRVSITNMRKMRFFQQGAYISVDFGAKVVEVATLGGGPEAPADAVRLPLPNNEAIFAWKIPVIDKDALTSELEHFLECVRTGAEPRTSGKRGLKALEIADRIVVAAKE
jgi:predicted dehydrogenase